MTAGVAGRPAGDPGDPGDRSGGAAAPGAPDRPAERPTPPARWQRVLGGLIVGLGAVELGLLECFFVPLRIGGTAVPLAPLVAVVGNVVLIRLMHRVTATRLASVVPVVVWLGLVLVLATRTAEGDLVVPGTWPGLLFLFGGTLAAAVTAGRILGSRHR